MDKIAEQAVNCLREARIALANVALVLDVADGGDGPGLTAAQADEMWVAIRTVLPDAGKKSQIKVEADHLSRLESAQRRATLWELRCRHAEKVANECMSRLALLGSNTDDITPNDALIEIEEELRQIATMSD